VAAALQDHGRARIVGTSTRGQGKIATLMPLRGGAGLKLTTGKLFRPNGKGVDEIGITPDVLVEREAQSPYGSAEDRQFEAALQQLGAK